MAVILPLVVAPERDDRRYPAGAVVLWCCGAGWLCYVRWCNVMGRHGGRRCRCGGRPEQPERLRALWLFLRWWLCGELKHRRDGGGALLFWSACYRAG
ncbi:hypothetical protein [Escherichia coli]|uniref:hypothetical protein n=1 Tax=Escherichia coli TaxID=562 RepID=UPI0020CDFE5F|nr:hypothetical protein [Escherichia coli]MCQ0105031.1 hypothetical protein [Escherichia coli]UIU65226.1 hypothetical protein H6S28_19980 [Escherichia coli]